MSLEVMTILCRCENIETSEGVPLDVTGVAQVIASQKTREHKAVADDGHQRMTEGYGSTNQLTFSVCLFSSSSWLLFSFSKSKGHKRLSLTWASPKR